MATVPLEAMAMDVQSAEAPEDIFSRAGIDKLVDPNAFAAVLPCLEAWWAAIRQLCLKHPPR